MPGPIGSIDPGQRRLVERLALQALRRFHREQPLAADLRIDALVARIRSAAAHGARRPTGHRGATPLTLPDADLRRVIEDLAAAGTLVRTGRRVRLAGGAPGLDPEMRERVDRLLEGLRAAGADPPRVDGVAARLGIPPAVVAQLRSSGTLRQLAAGIDLPADVWAAIAARLDDLPGPLTVARVRDELRTSRRVAEAILEARGGTSGRRGR